MTLSPILTNSQSLSKLELLISLFSYFYTMKKTTNKRMLANYLQEPIHTIKMISTRFYFIKDTLFYVGSKGEINSHGQYDLEIAKKTVFDYLSGLRSLDWLGQLK